VQEMSAKSLGMTTVVDGERHVLGIFTDGDLRRCVGKMSNVARGKVVDVMTHAPRSIEATALAIDCVERMETPPKVMQLVVLDHEGRLAGVVHMHDLFRARVV